MQADRMDVIRERASILDIRDSEIKDDATSTSSDGATPV